MESINNQSEATLLGYFETVRSTFLAKKILLESNIKEEGGEIKIEYSLLSNEVIEKTENNFSEEIFYKALKKENQELYLNVLEDLLTALLSSSWNVFEMIIKDLPNNDYSTDSSKQQADFYRNVFDFTQDEKNDIELFYYIRNAICHYNGAYNAYKNIDRNYRGHHFKSIENEGNQIELDFDVAWKISFDLEGYAMKAWGNANRQP